MSVYIRTEQENDHDSIREVNILAFNNQENEAKLIENIRKTEYFIPDLSLIAVNHQSNVIGHILFSEIQLETANAILPTLGLAPMAVQPQYQRQGIGSRLVAKGLEYCKELGCEHIFVLGHPHYYPKFGFVPANIFGITSTFPVPDEAFMALELTENSLNGKGGTVLYPPAFHNV